MRKVGVVRIALVLMIGTFPLLRCSVPADEVEKVPLTTSSPEALELFLQGRDLVEKIRLQESREYFQKALAKDPNFAMAHLNLAFAQPTADGFFESLEKAVSLADQASDGEQLWIRGVEAGSGGLSMKQREYYTELVSAYPNDERAHNLLATNYFGQQEYAKALAEYEKAIEINPEFSQPYNQVGYAYRFLGKYEAAEEAFKKYIEIIPDDPNPQDSYAELLMKMGNYETSIEHYEKALSINATFIPSYIGIATNLNYLGEHEKAREQLKKFYEKAADDGQRRQALFAAAVSYVDEGKIDKALEVLAERYALAEKNDDSAALSGDLNNMGNILLEAGHLEKAQTKFDKSIALTRESDRSRESKENAERFYLFNSARVALAQGDLATAKAKQDEHRQRVEATNNQGQIRLSHQLAGTIALREEDYDTALTELGQANQLNSYNLYRMALAYEGKGETEKAKEMYRKAAEFNPLNSVNHAFIRKEAQSKASTT
jgi:tetratricopeptide (TPR) repeat protein